MAITCHCPVCQSSLLPVSAINWTIAILIVPNGAWQILDLCEASCSRLQTYLDQPQRLRSSSTLDRRPSFALCWFPGWPSGGVNGRPFFQAGKPFIRLGSHLSGWEAICKAGKPLVRLGSHPGWEAVCQAGKHFYQAGKPQDSTCPSALIDSQSLGGFCLGMIYFP